MEKNQRQKIYDWIVKNKTKSGAEYKVAGKYIIIPYNDYVTIASRIRQTYRYAGYKTISRPSPESVEMSIFIK